jgi:hypothetical protein
MNKENKQDLYELINKIVDILDIVQEQIDDMHHHLGFEKTTADEYNKKVMKRNKKNKSIISNIGYRGEE